MGCQQRGSTTSTSATALLTSSCSTRIPKLFPPKPVIRPLNGRDTILLHVGTRLFAWDLETGREAWPPLELGTRPVQSAQFSDLDGDGEPEALLLFSKGDYLSELTLKVFFLKNCQLAVSQLWSTHH